MPSTVNEPVWAPDRTASCIWAMVFANAASTRGSLIALTIAGATLGSAAAPGSPPRDLARHLVGEPLTHRGRGRAAHGPRRGWCPGRARRARRSTRRNRSKPRGSQWSGAGGRSCSIPSGVRSHPGLVGAAGTRLKVHGSAEPSAGLLCYCRGRRKGPFGVEEAPLDAARARCVAAARDRRSAGRRAARPSGG